MSKPDPQPSSEALLRFTILSKLLGRMSLGESRAQAAAAISRCTHTLRSGQPRRVSPRTLYRWLAAWEQEGLAGLEKRRRPDAPASSVLPERFLDFLVKEKESDVHASIPELIERAKERGLLDPDQAVHRSSVWRAALRLGVSASRRKGAKTRDSRRFSHPHRMDMVMCDGKHFRAGRERKKRVALFFIDDATRMCLHVVVGSSETAALFQRGLFECICHFGLMSKLFLDNGPGFIAEDTCAVVARLGALLIHGEAGYPEGRGKCERFNRSAKADVLRGLDGRADIDPDYGALELRLSHWIREVYAHRPHESLRGDTPWQRFEADSKPLRLPDDRESLRARFEVWVERRVTADHTISIGSVQFEMPRGYAGQKVVLRRRLLEGTIGFLHEGRLIQLEPVDLAANARARRSKDFSALSDEPPIAPTTAAELRFQRDLGSVVGPDGGFHDPLSPDDEEHSR